MVERYSKRDGPLLERLPLQRLTYLVHHCCRFHRVSFFSSLVPSMFMNAFLKSFNRPCLMARILYLRACLHSRPFGHTTDVRTRNGRAGALRAQVSIFVEL